MKVNTIADDEIAKYRQLVTVARGAAVRGEPTSISTNKSVFTQVSCHELSVRCINKSINNYNAVTISNPNPKIVKTKAFPTMGILLEAAAVLLQLSCGK